ncbi:MAG: protein tyrosine phosphatase family protein [Leptolyngbyaceae bacterium]|nr:protein tyrosine phosphatase family protein [Leptolyngbyaceae bacterium]
MPISPVNEIRSFLALSDSVATAGQPTEEQFASLRAAGYEIVINLALPTSTHALPNEQAVVESQGMQYVHIPVLWETPTLEDLDRFFSVMAASNGKRILVHCALNMRVSAFMYLYRLLCEGVSEVEAKQDLNQIWVPNDDWQRFIDQAIAHYSQPLTPGT